MTELRARARRLECFQRSVLANIIVGLEDKLNTRHDTPEAEAKINRVKIGKEVYLW